MELCKQLVRDKVKAVSNVLAYFIGSIRGPTTTVNCGWTVSLSLWQLRYTLLDSIRRGQEINVAARNLIKTGEAETQNGNGNENAANTMGRECCLWL